MAELARIEPEPPTRAVGARRRVSARAALLAASGALGVVLGGWWLHDRLANVHVVDARVGATMVLLSSRIAGWVVDVPVREGQRVPAGTALIAVDDRQARLKRDELRAARATLDAQIEAARAEIAFVEASTESRIEAAASALEAARSDLEAARSRRETFHDEWQRADALRERGLLSDQDWAARRNAFRTAEQAEAGRQADLRGAEADLATARAERARIDVLRADVTRLDNERRAVGLQEQRASEELKDHVIKAPIGGVIDETFIDAGEYVAAGQRVLMLHDPDDLWVATRVKETDLKHLRVGKRAEVRVDAFPDTVYLAEVAHIGHAATSEFALLPNPNPSGNFTKITQRVEVKLTFDEPDPRLRPGLMVEVKVRKGD